MFNFRSRVFLIAAMSLSIPFSAHAQLEEIIVTANKREENIQDVPISITSVTEQQLADGRIQTTQDLQSIVPSLNYGELTV